MEENQYTLSEELALEISKLFDDYKEIPTPREALKALQIVKENIEIQWPKDI